MDEREVHDLLRGAAETVEPSPDLPDRAERRYRRRRARGRVLAVVVVVAVVASGVATAAAISGDHSRPEVDHPAPIVPLEREPIDPNAFTSLAFVDATAGYGIATSGTDAVFAKTDDGARTWRVVGSLPEGARHVELAGKRGHRDAVLVVWGVGVYVSVDQGATWKPALPHAGVVVATPGRIWASVSCAELEVCRARLAISDDAGRTWRDTALVPPDGSGVTAIATQTHDTAYVVELGVPKIIAITTDGGQHWLHREAPCADAWHLALGADGHSLMLVCSEALRQDWKVYFSVDDAKTWSAGPPLPPRSPVYSVGAIGGSTFAVGLGNWMKGPLIGPVIDQWESRVLPQPFGEVHALAALPGSGTFFASSRSGVWFRSDDDNWEQRTPPAPRPSTLAGPPAVGFLSARTGNDVHDLSVWGWNGDKVATLRTKSAAECCNVNSMSPDGTRVLVLGDGSAPPEVLDVHGNSIGQLGPNTGSIIWADDSRHLCELRPHDTDGSLPQGPADLVLIDPGHGERTVAQVPGYGPHTQPDWLRCSVVDDQAIVADQFTTQNFSITGVQLSTGRTYTPKWVPTNSDAVIAISGNGRYVVESQFGGGLRYAIVDTLSGAVVGHVDGQPMELSWDGHLVVELINGFDIAVVDWRSGAVLWRSANRHEAAGGPGGIVSAATVSARPDSDDLALSVSDLPGRDPNVAQLWLVTPTTPPKLLADAVTAGII